MKNSNPNLKKIIKTYGLIIPALVLACIFKPGAVYAQLPYIAYSGPQTYLTNVAITPLSPVNTGAGVPATVYGQVSTLAGSGQTGANNGNGNVATFQSPNGLATDAQGNVYVADQYNSLIRKITPAGVVGTLAGSVNGYQDGTGSGASFFIPVAVATDSQGNVYVADQNNNVIRKVTPAGVVTTFAGSGTQGSSNGLGGNASFFLPNGIATDAQGNVYVSELSNLIRKITPAGLVSTLAGSGNIGSANGTGTAASFSAPQGLATDTAGNVYVADAGNNCIRKITPAGVVTTYAKTGLNFPTGLAIDGQGYLYVTDNNLIRKISPAGVITTLAGSGAQGATNGVGTAASFFLPQGIALDNQGNIFVGDTQNALIRKIINTGYAIAPALPAGLSFDSTTGIISGTPTVAGPATNYSITGYNTSGSSTATVSIMVLDGHLPYIAYSGPQTYLTNVAITPLSPVNTGAGVPATVYGQVSTLAGSGQTGANNGNGNVATFQSPNGLATDAQGNVYVADQYNSLVRKITPAGVVGTLAGSVNGYQDGTGSGASFFIPVAVATDSQGNVYVADQNNNVIRKVTPAGVVTTFAGSGTQGSSNGLGGNASFFLPNGIATDAQGNVYVSELSNLIRKITPAGLVSTLAGSGNIGSANGTGTAASFSAPQGLATDTAGNVYVADAGNNCIRKITPAGVVTTYAKTGLNFPTGLAIDGQGYLYVTDNNLIRKISPAGVITTLAGSGAQGATNGVGTAASFFLPQGIALDNQGNIFVGDTQNALIRKIINTGYAIAPALPAGLSFDSTTGIITGTPTVAGPATNYSITGYNTSGSSTATVSIMVLDGHLPYIAYSGPQTYLTNVAITPLSPVNTGAGVPATVYGQVSTLAGSGQTGANNGNGNVATFQSPNGLATDAQGNVYVADQYNSLVRKITPAGVVSTLAGSVNGYQDGTGSGASFFIPVAVATDSQGNVYVADQNNNVIRKVTPAGVVTTFAGSGTQGSSNGLGGNASFFLPNGIATDAQGNVYVSELSNLIRKITPAGLVSTLAGSGNIGSANGTGTAASFSAPQGLATDTAGNVYVADAGNNCIRKITPAGVVTTYAKTGLNFPTGLAIDGQGYLYVTDNNLIRKISPAGVITTLAGSGAQGATNGVGTAASFFLPQGIALDNQGNIFVGDTQNALIRKIINTGYTIAPALPAGLSFDSTTGIITGTPTVAGPATNYTIIAYNIYGSGSATLNITVPFSPDANLLSLAISSGTLSPSFNVATTTYTASVSNATTSITVSPTANNAGATIKVNGTTVASGTASSAVPLIIGANTINVAVTAQDGITQITYTIIVTRLPNNANLSNLTISSGTLSPAFISSTAGYTGTVSNATASITVTPTTSDARATVTVNGIAIPSGSPSASITLNGGVNIIYVVVLAQDGTRKTYSITITKPLSANANLANLTISGSTLSPVFASSTVGYTATVSATTTSIQLTPTTSDVNATVRVNGVTVKSGIASGGVPLGVGVNSVHAIVNAQDGTQRTYTVTVTRLSNNANLANLTTGSGTLSPTFISSTTGYTGTVSVSTTSITITPTTAEAHATVKINGTAVISASASASITLSNGVNTIHVVVLAQDGTQKTYTITINKSLSSNANLSNLAISSGTLAPVFISSTVGYTATVSAATTSIQLTPTTTDVNATVQINGVPVTSGSASASVPLGIGVNSVHAVVHAQDGTQRTYTVTVTRLSNNANMASLTVSSGRLSPAFVSSTTGYLDTVSNATTSIQITPTTSDTRATVTVNGTAVTSGSASAAIPLVVGNNTIYAVVLAQDGTRKTYTLTVRRLTTGGLNSLYLHGDGEQKPLISSLDKKVEANNILSPNGDGINDIWVVKNIAFYPDNMVTVYNRAGEVVFTKKGYTNDWDCTYRGAVLSEGTYYYLLDLGNGESVKGFITVVSH